MNVGGPAQAPGRAGRARAAVVAEQVGAARRPSASTSPGGDQQPGVADDLGQRGRVGRDDRAAARHGLERREPEALVARRQRAQRRPPVQRVERRLVDLAEPAHARAVEPGHLDAIPVGPTTTSVRSGCVARRRC